MNDELSSDPVERSRQIMARQSLYHLEDVLDQLKFSRPGWAQLLIHTWQNEVRQQRLLTGQEDRFFVDMEEEE